MTRLLTVDDDWSRAPWDARVGQFFTLGEVCQYDPERRIYDRNIRGRVLALARELDRIRGDWGAPIIVTSWYRPPAVNRRVGGAPMSQHLTGAAADIRPANGRGVEFEQWLDSRWPYALGYGQAEGLGFTHIDLRPGRLRWHYAK